MKLIAQENFSWAHRHVEIVAYAAGETIETEDPDLIRVSVEEGWASDSSADSKKRSKKQSVEDATSEAAQEQQ